MKEFVMAALPWLLMGLALALIAAAFDEARKKGTEKAFGQRIAAGAGLGIMVSAILNACIFLESNVVYFVMGPLLGMAIASLISREEKAK